MSNSRKYYKALAFVAFLLPFGYTTYKNFEIAFPGATMISSSVIDHSAQGLEVPLIVICKKQAFKIEQEFMTFAEYSENTLKLSDFLVKIESKRIETHTNDSLESGLFDIVPLSTFYRGKCYILKTSLKLTGDRNVRLKIKSDINLVMLLLSHQEVIQMWGELWSEPPTEFELGTKEGMIDVNMRKSLRESSHSGNCEESEGNVPWSGSCLDQLIKTKLK